MTTNPTDPTVASLIDDAAELVDLDPARAELWVSGLLADTADQGLLAELVSSVSTDSVEHHRLLVAAIAAVAEPSLAGGAQTAVEVAPPTTPAWAVHLGSAVPVDAMRVITDGGHTSTIVRYTHGDDSRHLLLVDLAPADQPPGALDIRFAPDGLFDEPIDDPEIELQPAELAAVAPDVVAAIANPIGDESSIELNLFAARRRAEALIAATGIDGALGSTTSGAASVVDHEPPVGDEAMPDGAADAAAVEALEAALPRWFGDDAELSPSSQGLAVAAERILAVAAAPDTADDMQVVFAAGGLRGDEPVDELVYRSVGAYVVPRSLDAFEATEVEAIRHLEWADWFGAVAVLVRKGVGTKVTPAEMVKAINRCPEVTTTIPKADATYVAWSFERTLHAWELTGVLSDDAELTAFGQQVLPHALRHRWVTG